MSWTCPDCRTEIDDAVPRTQHQGDPLCLMIQARAMQTRNLKRAGSTHATQARAGIEFTWVMTAFDADTQRPTYTRYAPAWAVCVAECTAVSAAERVLVIEHCLQHDAARRACETGFRLGLTIARARKGGRPPTPAVTRGVKDFFRGVLTTTGQ